MWPMIKNFFKKYVLRDLEETAGRNSRSKRRLSNSENEKPAKFPKLSPGTCATSQSAGLYRIPLTSGNWNPVNTSEMQVDEKNSCSGRELLNVCEMQTDDTSNENNIEKEDEDDIQVLRVYESLATKAERQKNIVFRSKSHLDSKRSSKNLMTTKTDKRLSALDKTEDLEQHRRYKALLNESSASLNLGYKNDPVTNSFYPEENTMTPPAEKMIGPSEYSDFGAGHPSSGTAEMILHSAKMTTNWILTVEEKHKRLIQEHIAKVEKTRALTKHFRNGNEKLEKTLERKQWDLRSAFEIFKIEDEAHVLPTLTPAMEEVIAKALKEHPEHEKIMSACNVVITRKDIHTLYGSSWLNDEVINCYMEMIKERSRVSNGAYPKVLTFNTFFYPNLCTRGNTFLKRWNKKVNVFSYDMILAPIHEGIHWCLVQMDFRTKRIVYLDSMGGKNQRCLELFLGYFVFEGDDRNIPFHPEEWKLEHAMNNPKQRNGSDCGVFACTYAEFLSRDAKFRFDQSDMPFLRRKMVYEILHGLLPM